MTHNQLFRSRENRMIAGVAGGLADYFKIDVALVRLLWIMAIFFGGGGVLAYIIAWIVIPEEKDKNRSDSFESGSAAQTGAKEDSYEKTVVVETTVNRTSKEKKLNSVGYILIGLGLIVLFKENLPWHLAKYFWPLFLMGLGLFLLVKR